MEMCVVYIQPNIVYIQPNVVYIQPNVPMNELVPSDRVCWCKQNVYSSKIIMHVDASKATHLNHKHK